MKRLISMWAAALLACVVVIGFTPAQATMTAPNLKPYIGSSVTSVDCRLWKHCHWVRGFRHCHVCGWPERYPK
jgi:uncharacterized membrane protein YesL